jgi:microcystin degradation protein MlrC
MKGINFLKYIVGTFSLECNSFSPLRADLDYFRNNGYLLFGNSIIDYHEEVKNELAGFIRTSCEKGTDIIPTCAVWAVPYGPVKADTYEILKNEFLSRITSCSDFDGVYLSVHGAMVVEGIDDPEGDLIETIRSILKSKSIVVSCDFHANITDKMVKHSDILIGYNSFPHTNTYETGIKAATLAHEYEHNFKSLDRIFIKLPIITPHEKLTIVGDTPMARIIDQINETEKKTGILSVSFFNVQTWLDIDDLGASIVGVSEKTKTKSLMRFMSQLALKFWEDRESYYDFKMYSPRDAILDGLKNDDAPIILNEPSDNVGAGATGDSTHVLRELLDLKVNQPSILTIVDPDSVEQAILAGIGNELELHVGGKINTEHNPSIKVRGKVRTIFDGRYRYTGPVYHGVETSMGKTVVLEISGNIYIELTELPVFTIDPEHYRCVGLFPERMKFVLIKSQGSYKASYNHIGKKVYTMDTPGLARSNVKMIPFKKINADALYPFNETLNFVPAPSVF